MSNLKAKLLVEVNIGDVENKYPNFQFNYNDKEDFLQNNIVAGLEHIADEQEYEAGYETVVANTMLDVMDSFVSVGDKVMYIKDNKPIFGTVLTINSDYCNIDAVINGNGVEVRDVEIESLITIYDFLEEV